MSHSNTTFDFSDSKFWYRNGDRQNPTKIPLKPSLFAFSKNEGNNNIQAVNTVNLFQPQQGIWDSKNKAKFRQIRVVIVFYVFCCNWNWFFYTAPKYEACSYFRLFVNDEYINRNI